MEVRAPYIPAQSTEPLDEATELPSNGDLHLSLEVVLARELVTPVFQPIVDLITGEVVAFEALARGPRGSALESPDALFEAARATGRLAELDWLCRVRALETAAAHLTTPAAAFINIEPEVAGSPIPRHLRQRFRQAASDLPVVVEFTERSLVTDPAGLLAIGERVRALGWGVALDDVGANSQSLALMPFLCPDVIKLDLRLVQMRPDLDVAKIMSAVAAQVERTGCEVLAEGIETAEQIELAQALGARLGQGWHLGRPGSLREQACLLRPEARSARPVRRIDPVDLSSASTKSLYAIAAACRPSRRSTKPLLIEISKLLEREAAAIGDTAVILSAFEDARHFTSRTQGRYRELGRKLAFVGALGADMRLVPVNHVRGARLRAGDPVLGEWHAVVLGPHFSAALVAQDLGDDGPDETRRFDYVLTYDRDLVTRIAVGLMARITPEGES